MCILLSQFSRRTFSTGSRTKGHSYGQRAILWTKATSPLHLVNEKIFSEGEYKDFLSLCNRDITILALLEEHEGFTARQISLKLNMPKTTVVSAVSRLVKQNYICREKNPLDGREQLLSLTPKGEKINQQHRQYETLFIEEFMGLFDQEDYGRLVEILERSSECSITE